MKTRHTHAGFTLVEMLVVIAILGILMSMMVPAAGLILKRVKGAQARSDAGIAVTVMGKYYAEYNRWPDFAKVAGDKYTDNVWVSTMSPKPGEEPANNFKRIVFFEPGKGVLGTAAPYTGNYVDPWGKPFQYDVDTDRNGTCVNPNGGEVRAQAIVWSAGPDGDYTTWEDNETSWE